MNTQPNSRSRMKQAYRLISGADIPYLLQQIPQPPKQLWVEGFISDEASGIRAEDVGSEKDPLKYLCVIGSRKHSAYGREACQKLIAGLSGYNICIVSGLALGIDSIAHEAALDAGLVTFAFPGSGLDRSVLYPGSRHKLAERIIEAGGALISEFDLDQHADIWTFPQRNRLMAGMCHATIMIEAAADSGTLITASLAHEYNRDVLALPGEIFSPLTYGPHKWLHMGARIVRCSEDILEVLGIEIGQHTIPFAQHGQNKRAPSNRSNLKETERRIIDLISIEPLGREEIIARLDLDASTVSVHISMLELKDIVTWRNGKLSLR